MDSGLGSVECDRQKTVDGYICTVKLDKFAATSAKCVLGTSIVTDVFAMHFPDSIGSSLWVIQIYPNGQYDADGYSNGHLSAYLKLISAENENKSLFADIELNCFQYRRPMQTKQKAVNRCFEWSRKSARWFGGQLVLLSELSCSGDVSVQIECHLKAHKPKSLDKEKTMQFVSYRPTAQPHYRSTDIRYRNTPMTINTDQTVESPEKSDACALKEKTNAEIDDKIMKPVNDVDDVEKEVVPNLSREQKIISSETIGHADDTVNNMDQRQPLQQTQVETARNGFVSAVFATIIRIFRSLTGFPKFIFDSLFGN